MVCIFCSKKQIAHYVHAYHSILTRILLLTSVKQMSEHVSINIILPVGLVSIIAHYEQFVLTTEYPYHSILTRILLLKA